MAMPFPYVSAGDAHFQGVWNFLCWLQISLYVIREDSGLTQKILLICVDVVQDVEWAWRHTLPGGGAYWWEYHVAWLFLDETSCSRIIIQQICIMFFFVRHLQIESWTSRRWKTSWIFYQIPLKGEEHSMIHVLLMYYPVKTLIELSTYR